MKKAFILFRITPFDSTIVNVIKLLNICWIQLYQKQSVLKSNPHPVIVNHCLHRLTLHLINHIPSTNCLLFSNILNSPTSPCPLPHSPTPPLPHSPTPVTRRFVHPATRPTLHHFTYDILSPRLLVHFSSRDEDLRLLVPVSIK